MKKFLFAIIALLSLPISVSAAQFEKGVHYDVLPRQATDKPEVIEFFSFYCGHCYKFEPLMEEVEKNLKQGVVFKRNHVDFLYYVDRVSRKRHPETGKITSQGYAAAQVLNVAPALTEEIFKRHFLENNQIKSSADLKEAFKAVGVKVADFDKAYNSFPVNSITSRMRQESDKYGITGTPSVIVNGKYKVKPTGLSNSKDFVKDYVALVNYLVTLK